MIKQICRERIAKAKVEFDKVVAETQPACLYAVELALSIALRHASASAFQGAAAKISVLDQS